MDRSKLPSLSMSTPPPNNICNDIIVEILSWLPVDSLLRFKSVCKSWFSLITNPRFAKLQTATAQIHNPTIMFVSDTHYSLKSMDKLVSSSSSSSSSTVLEKLEMVYPFDSTKYVCFIVGSCNGLICICMIPATYFDHVNNDDRNEILGLWNPSTKEFKQLPSHEEVEDDAPFKFPPYRDGNGRRRRRGLSKVASYGFGYDHVMEDYKVIASVRWFSRKDDDDEYDEMDDDDEEVMDHHYMYHYEVRVYTLGTDSWRRIQGTPPYESKWFSNTPWLHANGAFHRIAELSSSDTRILSFDIVEEVHRQVWKPPDCFYTRYCKLAVLRGCLCLYSYVEPLSTEVWMMMNYGVKESWTKLFMIPACEEHCQLFKPVWFCRNGELLMEDESHSKLFIYDPKHNETKLLNSRSNTMKFMLQTVIYIASLVSLKSQKEIEKELIIC